MRTKQSFFQRMCTDNEINCNALVSMADQSLGIGDRTGKRAPEEIITGQYYVKRSRLLKLSNFQRYMRVLGLSD